MPGANEVLGCPQANKICPINSSPKISDDLFSRLSKFYQKLFFTILTFISKLLSGCPPYPGCPEPSTFSLTFYAFTLIFYIYLGYIHFLKKTPSLDVPRLDARSRRTPRTHLCTPLRRCDSLRQREGSRACDVTLFKFVIIYSKLEIECYV